MQTTIHPPCPQIGNNVNDVRDGQESWAKGIIINTGTHTGFHNAYIIYGTHISLFISHSSLFCVIFKIFHRIIKVYL